MSKTTLKLESPLRYLIGSKQRRFSFANHIIHAYVWSVLLENSHKQNNGTAVYKSGNMHCRQHSLCFCGPPLHSKNRLVCLQLSGAHGTRSTTTYQGGSQLRASCTVSCCMCSSTLKATQAGSSNNTGKPMCVI